RSSDLLAGDRIMTVRQADASAALRRPSPPSAAAAFQRAKAPPCSQVLPALPDYEVKPLLPYQPSRQGPPIAVADVNGDGLDDVFVGGIGANRGKLFLQRSDGSFVEAWATEGTYEDWGALFFDANGDGRPDLYVASCGYQHTPLSRLQQDRLYINQGGGRFVRDSAALPPMLTCTAAIAAGDYTGDGRMDLFVGGRLT